MENIWRADLLRLGRQGENDARSVVAYIDPWQREFPGAQVRLLCTRPGEQLPYQPNGVSIVGNAVTWRPDATDTEKNGYGEAELQAYVGDVIIKSCVVKTFVEPCLQGEEQPTPPAPLDTWVDIINGKQDAPTTAGTNGQVLALNAELEPIWKTVSGGGGGGAEIDDTAGAGDTDKAWSADKITTELAGKQATLPTGGTVNQVLALDAQGNLIWIDKVSFNQNLTSGVQIAAIRVNGALTQIYAPSPAVSVITNPATTLTLQPCPVTYKWGEVAELTLTVTATTEYHFMFTCPSSAATVLTITGETQRTGDTLEAGKTYEVDIWAGVTLIREVA